MLEINALSYASRTFFFLGCVLSGCVTSTSAPNFQNAPAPRSRLDVAVLYVIRDSAVPYAYPGYVDIDGTKTVSLAQQGFTWLYLKPGDHTFSHYWPSLAGMPKVNFNHSFLAGRTYVFEMKGKNVGRTLSTEIQTVDLNDAKMHMASCCRYTAPVAPSAESTLDDFKNILPRS